MDGHKFPLTLFLGWVVCEFFPAFLPASVSEEVYSIVYLYSEDLATIMLATACYCSLSYTSTAIKGVSLSVVIVAWSILITNIAVDSDIISPSYSTGLVLAFILVSLQSFMVRFMLHLEDGEFTIPEPGRIYFIIKKPHDRLGMIGLLLYGRYGGLSVYLDGYHYHFSKKEGKMVKEFQPNCFKGKKMLDLGPSTPEKEKDLERSTGGKWTTLNNCLFVCLTWERKWS